MTRCSLCPSHKARRNWVGPQFADPALFLTHRVLFIGEGPGRWEDKHGIPFVGDSGKELNGLYLRAAGLDRSEVSVTNALKCMQEKPSEELIDCCSRLHLPEEIRAIQPAVIVTLGAAAASIFTDPESASPPVSLSMDHAIPFTRTYSSGWFSHTCPVISTFHPAAAMRDTRLMSYILEAFQNLRLLLDGSLAPRDLPGPDYSPYAGRNYAEIKTVEHFRHITSLAPHGGDRLTSIDTEHDSSHLSKPPFCLSFSFTPRTGYVIRNTNRSVISEFETWIGDRVLVFHFSVGDKEDLRRMGVEVEGIRCEDTGVRAYNLQKYESLGLKALAWRLLGVQMREYEDVVAPHGTKAAVEWLRRAAAVKWEQERKLRQTAVWKKAARILKDLETGTVNGRKTKEPTDPVKRWEGIAEEERGVVEKSLGRIPQPSIVRVPEREMVEYSGQDADMTLSLLPVLRREAGLVRGMFR